MSRGLGVQERKILEVLDRHENPRVRLIDLVHTKAELESLRRAAKSLERKGLIGTYRMGRRGELILTTPELAEKGRKDWVNDQAINAQVALNRAEKRYRETKAKWDAVKATANEGAE